MGFENIFESFQQNKKTGRHLSQGELLRNRAEQLQNLISVGREGFESKKIKDMDKKERKHLQKLESSYNKLVSDYANSYKSFLLEHEKLQADVMKCKSKCLEIHNQSTQDYSNKRLACSAGCDLKAPYITKCKDTYRGLAKDSSKGCTELTDGKCDGGSITLGQNEYVAGEANVDKQGISLKDGCCECGGGKGGKPKGVINKTIVSSCSNLAAAFGVAEGSTPDQVYKSACLQAQVSNPSKNANFYKQFDKIQSKNSAVTGAAEKLYADIDTLHEVRKKLDENIESEEAKLANNLKRFETNYDTLQRLGGRDPVTGKPKSVNPTFLAQQEEKRLQQRSEEMKFYFWSILAIVLAVSTIINFQRKIQ
tara:strand:+ start:1307 stop:2404 length:1098 start_codon:yes stop_codon:yes gene_type:complete